MSAGVEIYNYVSNQKGSPALYSDILANRPAFGFVGRLFVSTDTLEIYRDTGASWALISGGGGGGVNIYNSDGTLTGARTVTMAGNNLVFEGGAGTNRIRMSADAGQARIFSFASANVARWAFRVDGAETGSNAGGDWALRAYNDAGTYTFSPISASRKTGEKSFYAEENLTAGSDALAGVFNIAGGTYSAGLTMIGGNAHAAQFNNYTIANGGSFTFASSSFVGAVGNVLRLQANAAGTVTMTAATPGLRAANAALNQIQWNTATGAALTYTHLANIQTLGILRLVTAGSLAVTNGYGILINDLNEYGYSGTGAGALTITNRWGVYQDGTLDRNYFAGRAAFGTTAVSANAQVTINGNLLLSGSGRSLYFGGIFDYIGYNAGFTFVYGGTLFAYFDGPQLGLNLSSSIVTTNGTRWIRLQTGTVPNTTGSDHALFYVADITAGNAAFHTRTENGSVVKLYQETTAISSSAFVANVGTPINDTSTIDGYTLLQVVKALRNQGLLQ